MGFTIKTDYENSLKQIAITVHGFIFGRALLIGRSFASEIWGAYFQEGIFFLGGGLIIGILRSQDHAGTRELGV